MKKDIGVLKVSKSKCMVCADPTWACALEAILGEGIVDLCAEHQDYLFEKYAIPYEEPSKAVQ